MIEVSVETCITDLKAFFAFFKFLTCLPISLETLHNPYFLVEEIIFVRETNLACKCFVDI